MRGVKVVSRIRWNFVILQGALKINLSFREKKKNDVTMFKNKRKKLNFESKIEFDEK